MKCLNKECNWYHSKSNCLVGRENSCDDFIPESEKPSPPSVDSQSAGWVCPKCQGEGWLWWNELDDYSGPALETGQDDTRYSCDRCTPNDKK